MVMAPIRITTKNGQLQGRARRIHASALLVMGLGLVLGSSAVQASRTTFAPIAAATAGPSATAEVVTDLPFAATRVITELPAGADPTSVSRGPFGTVVFVDRATASVYEVQDDGYPMTLAEAGGAGASKDMAAPILAVGAGHNIHVFDAEGRGWWNSRGDQVKAPWVERLRGGVDFDGRTTEANLIDPATKAITSYTREPRDYDLIMIEPASGDVLVFDMGRGGRKFVGIDLRIEREPDSDVLSLHMGGGGEVQAAMTHGLLFVLTVDGIERGTGLGWEPFKLDSPPSPEPDYHYMDGTGELEGQLWLYDAAGERIVVFDKLDGSYLASWAPGPDDPAMTDVRGMFVEPAGKRAGHVVTWVTPHAVYRSATVDPKAIKRPRFPHEGGLKPSSRAPGERAIDWSVEGARLQADELRLRAGGKRYSARGDILAEIDDGSQFSDRSLEMYWSEHGREMRMFVYLASDGQNWWIQEIWTYDGRKEGEWIEYEDLERLTRTPMGEALEGDLRLKPTSANRKGAAKGASLRIDGLRLTAYEQ